MSMFLFRDPWRIFAIPKAVGGKQLQASLIRSRLLLTALLSTSGTNATTFTVDKSNTVGGLKPLTCCFVTPPVYSKRYLAYQSCLADDLELSLIGNRIGLLHVNPPSARSFSTDNGQETCHHLYDIDTEDFVTLVKQNQEGLKGLYLIDVREPEELEETGEMPGSINIPLASVEDAFNKSPEDFKAAYGAAKPAVEDLNLVFSCRSGVRSLAALEIAQRLGYVNARHYMRGWLGWEEHLENTH